MTDSSTDGDEIGSGPGDRASEVTYEVGPDERPSEAVVRATAAFTNTPVIELEPLYDSLDPDHLDGLFGASGGRSAREGSSLTFVFDGCLVSVTREAVVVREDESDVD